MNTFHDEFAHELGERVEHLDPESAAGGRGIDRLMQRSDADSAGEGCDDVEEIPQGPGEPVETRCDETMARIGWLRWAMVSR
ncbi:hypothetical protein OG809_22620 [Kribbella soli]